MSAATDRGTRNLPLNPQFREELGRFTENGGAHGRALALAAILGAALIATWPDSLVLEQVRHTLTHKIEGNAAVAFVLLLALWTGATAPAGHGQFSVRQWALYVPLSPGRYLRGAWLGRMLDALLLVLIAAPLLLASAMAQGTPLWNWGALLAVLFGTAAFGAMAALCLQLWLDRIPARIAGAGLLLSVVLGAGWRIWPPLSPFAAFAGIHVPASANLWDWVVSPWPGFLLTQLLLNGALFGLAWRRVRNLRAKASAAAG